MVAVNNTYPVYQSSYAQRAPYQMATAAEQPENPTSSPIDTFRRVSSMVGAGAGGGLAAYKFSEAMAEGMYNHSQLGELGGIKGVAFASFKEMGTIGIKGAGVSALVSAGVSAVANGMGLAQGKIDKNTAAKNVVGDTITGAIGGLSAVTLGGLGGLAMVKMGMTGLPITIATVAIGAASGVAAAAIKDKIMKN